MTGKIRAWLPWLLLPAIAGLVGLPLVAILYAGKLAAPVHRVVGPPGAGLQGREVEFRSGSGVWIRGWFIPGCQGRGGVVLMHGLRSDRRGMLGRARFLNRQGYSLLLFDFQAHGSSGGGPITFGHLEALDARAAVQFLRSEIPQEPVAAIGVSLGGAASVLGPGPLPVDAMVLEAVYADIHKAVADRLRARLGPPGAWLTPLFTLQLRPRLGIPATELMPVEAIAEVRCPVLVIGGTEDRRTPLHESERLFAAAPEPKEFWAVEGAAHEDFHRFAGPEYEKRVLDFLCLHLSGARPSG